MIEVGYIASVEEDVEEDEDVEVKGICLTSSFRLVLGRVAVILVDKEEEEGMKEEVNEVRGEKVGDG
jgi:hypothetical protein